MSSTRWTAMVGTVAGLATTALLVAAPAASAHPSAPYLRQGSSGSGVECLQRALVKGGGQELEIDAKFGPATRNAVVNLQRYFGLRVDGVVGPQTGDYVWMLFDKAYGSNGRDAWKDSGCWAYVPSTH